MNKSILLGLGLLLFCVIIGSQLASAPNPETIPISVSISNAAPEVRELTCNPDPVTLNESGSTIVVCTATLYDQNGYQDIHRDFSAGDAVGILVQNQSTLAACDFLDSSTQDNSSCYLNNTDATTQCSYSNPSGNEVDVECSWKVWWYMEPTSDLAGTWTAWIRVNDSTNNEDFNDTDIDVSDLLALNVTDEIDWGSQGVGSVAEEIVQVNNTGNVQIDIDVNATNMTCDSVPETNITPDNIAYNDTTGQCTTPADCCKVAYATGSVCPEFGTNFDLNEDATGTGGGPTAKNTYFTLIVPSGVSGTCTGWMTFTASKG